LPFSSALLALITKPLGLYLSQVLDANGRTWLDPVRPSARTAHLLASWALDPEQGAGLEAIHASPCCSSAWWAVVFTYAHPALTSTCCRSIRRDLPGLSDHLAFNTAVSFTDEHQLAELRRRSDDELLLADGRADASQLHRRPPRASPLRQRWSRGIARATAKTLGNFWVDLVRIDLLPARCRFASIFAIFLVAQGSSTNFKAYDTAKLIEPHTVQVAKMDANDQPVVDAAGKPVMEDKSLRANHRAGPDGLAGRHQDARHERRRLRQCQRRASLRESDAAARTSCRCSRSSLSAAG